MLQRTNLAVMLMDDVLIFFCPREYHCAGACVFNQIVAAVLDLLDADMASNSTSSVKSSVFHALNALLDKSKDPSVNGASVCLVSSCSYIYGYC